MSTSGVPQKSGRNFFHGPLPWILAGILVALVLNVSYRMWKAAEAEVVDEPEDVPPPFAQIKIN